MRLPIVAMCPLIVLASWALTRESNDSPKFSAQIKQPKASNFGSRVEAATPDPVKPNTSPETLSQPKFSQKTAQETGNQKSVSAQPNQASVPPVLADLPAPVSIHPETLLPSNELLNLAPATASNKSSTPRVVALSELPPPPPLIPLTDNGNNAIAQLPFPSTAIDPQSILKLPPPPTGINPQSVQLPPPPPTLSLPIASLSTTTKLSPPSYIVEPKATASLSPPNQVALVTSTANSAPIPAEYIVEPQLNAQKSSSSAQVATASLPELSSGMLPNQSAPELIPNRPNNVPSITSSTGITPPQTIPIRQQRLTEPQGYLQVATAKSDLKENKLIVPKSRLVSGANTLGTVDASYQIAQASLPELSPQILPTQSDNSSSNNLPPKSRLIPTTSSSGTRLNSAAEIVPSQSNDVPTTNTNPPPEIQDLQQKLNQLQTKPNQKDLSESSPSLTINNPSGFGADNNTGFISTTYQSRTRYTKNSDGALAFGVGLGDARKAVGVELSYTMASFGGSRDFGTGGFNVKVHRQLADDLSVAVGADGLVNTGQFNDFKNSFYGAATKIVRLTDDINKPLSRIAFTAGVGNGQFQNETDFAKNRNTVNPFASVAVRVAKPVSLITEWTGQDLAMGVSITPIKTKNFNFVITPAVRDIVGAGDGPDLC